VAQSNTELYERVFPYMPQNSIQTLKEVERRKDAFHQVPLDQKLKVRTPVFTYSCACVRACVLEWSVGTD
jgi:hypothetical protein